MVVVAPSSVFSLIVSSSSVDLKTSPYTMMPDILGRIDDCPHGGVFYMCNGFRGCCTMDPCMPGSTCPADKDRTPGRASYVSSLTPITSVLMITVTATTSLTTALTTSSTTLRPSLDPDFTFSLAEPSLRTITQSLSTIATPSANASASASARHAHSVPVAAVVGAVLGTVILCALLISVLLYERKRRRTKTYKAPAYPSSLVGSDITPQLSSKASSQFQQKIAALYRAESLTETNNPPQLDRREIGRYEHRRNSSIGRFAELPAEPLPWPGNSAHG